MTVDSLTLDAASAAVSAPSLRIKRAAPPRRDLLVLGALVAGLLLLTSVPYWFGYLVAPPDKQFSGILLDVPDGAQYLTWARESSHAIFIENKLTSEHGDAAYFNLFWLVIGRLATLLGTGFAQAAQLVRPVAGAFFLASIWWFVGLVTRPRLQRWVSFLVIALGGGFGWIFVIQKQFGGHIAYPLDLYTNEANTFLTVMAFPHQAMATGLLVSILGLAALAFERDNLRPALVAGLLAVLLGVQHGYDLLVVYAVVGSTAAALAIADRRRTIRVFVLASAVCGSSVPVAGYLQYLTTQSPIWRGVLAQYGNAGVFTPTPQHLLILMGLPFGMLVLGLPSLVRSAARVVRCRFVGVAPTQVLLGMWLGVGFLLLYIPTSFQIKMLGGWQVPAGLFATRILFDQLLPRLRRWRPVAGPRLPIFLAALFVLAVLPANAYLYAWRFVDLKRAEYPYYLNRDDVAAMRWLDEHSNPSEVVLSSLNVGEFIPSYSGNSAFLAHWAQTLDFFTKRYLVQEFFDPRFGDVERLKVLEGYGVGYVLYGQEERQLGTYNPDQATFLVKVFTSPTTSIYRVARVDPSQEG